MVLAPIEVSQEKGFVIRNLPYQMRNPCLAGEPGRSGHLVGLADVDKQGLAGE